MNDTTTDGSTIYVLLVYERAWGAGLRSQMRWTARGAFTSLEGAEAAKVTYLRSQWDTARWPQQGYPDFDTYYQARVGETEITALPLRTDT